ncbi:MAG: hypothetical protein SF053_09825 [Bacteroidia bacterium]|nr:hypothetical protein [Bacteroidia bacterium]
MKQYILCWVGACLLLVGHAAAQSRVQVGFYGESVQYPGMRIGSERSVFQTFTLNTFKSRRTRGDAFIGTSLAGYRHPAFWGVTLAEEVGMRLVFNDGVSIEGLAGLGVNVGLQPDSMQNRTPDQFPLAALLRDETYLQVPLTAGLGWQVSRKPQVLVYLRLTRIPQYGIETKAWSATGAAQAGLIFQVKERR